MTSLRVVFLLVGVSCVGGARPQTIPAKQVSSNIDYSGVSKYIREQMERLELLYTTEDFVRKYGYPVETHTVTTEDGYLLTVHRIPGSPKTATSGAKGPVLLMHGLGGASDSWVLMGAEKGLGFILADEGYDVWMGNARGNTYSRNHANLSPKDLTYNNYTWHEMGVYDLPAMIDYILKVTSQPQLFYIGHSMGATMFFVMNSLKPEYNRKIRLGVTMAPGVYMKNMRSLLRYGIPVVRTLVKSNSEKALVSLTLKVGVTYAKMINTLCSAESIFQGACITMFSATLGSNIKELNTTLLPTILTHSVSGHCVHLNNHFGQLVDTGRFQMYDLAKITAPVSLMYAMDDVLIHPEGVIRLSQRLPNLVNLVRVPDNRANHLDFLFSNHVKEFVFNDLLRFMSKF